MIATQDALGRPVDLPAPPTRIVSLVPSLTELLADLGLDEEVVGLTTFCVRPEGWRESKARVGGTKDVRLERIAQLQPDLILANKEENTLEAVKALGELAPVYVTDVGCLPAALRMIRAVGSLVGRTRRGNRLADEIQASFATLKAAPPRPAAYLIWRDPWMAVGSDTFIHDVMARAGFANVFGSRTRYPTVSEQELQAASPEHVLLSSEPFPFAAKHLPELERLLPAARLQLVDGQLFSWYGSRLRETPAYLRSLCGL